jgi:hypothetical protein
MSCSRGFVACLVSLLLATLAPHASPQALAGDNDQPALLKAQPVKADSEDDAVRKLIVERYNAAVEELQLRYPRLQAGSDPAHQCCEALKRVAQAGLELNERNAGRATLLEECVEMAKRLEELTRQRIDAGIRGYTPADLAEAKYVRADFEIQWLRAKEKLKGEKK